MHDALRYFSVVEINTGLICGCTPVLKPFFRHVLSKRTTRRSRQLEDSQASSIWMGKYPDDESHANYRNFIELERGKTAGQAVGVREIRCQGRMEEII